MSTQPSPLNRPVRVVMFGSGPQLTHDAQQFLCRLEAHPEIEFLGAFCQAEAQSLAAVWKDLWRRRKLLAFPLFIARLVVHAERRLKNPAGEAALKKTVSRLSSRIHFVRNIHSADVLDRVRTLQPDLGLVYGSPILKPKLFLIPRLGTLGIHHGQLPHYRGNKTAFWAMFNGEPYAGVTIQKINQGLDTGCIIKEGLVSTRSKSYPQVVRELEALGLDLYIQAILDVKDGTASYQAQPVGQGRLYKNPKIGDFITFSVRQLKRRLSSTG